MYLHISINTKFVHATIIRSMDYVATPYFRISRHTLQKPTDGLSVNEISLALIPFPVTALRTKSGSDGALRIQTGP